MVDQSFGSQSRSTKPTEEELRTILIGRSIANVMIEQGNPALGQADAMRLSCKGADGTILTVVLSSPVALIEDGRDVTVPETTDGKP